MVPPVTNATLNDESMKHGFPSCHRKTLPVLDPSGDYYYWWLNTMVFPVMYNLIIIVCRFGGTLREGL